MARARLRDRHQENLRRKLEVLKAEQAVNTGVPNESNSLEVAEHIVKEEFQPKPGTSNEDNNSDNEGYVLISIFINLSSNNICISFFLCLILSLEMRKM